MEAQDASGARLNICDTELYSAHQAFSAFREAVAGAFMPWSLERPPTNEFNARIANFSTKFVSFGRTRMTPLIGVRNKPEISKSPELCLYANYVISGRLVVEQGGKTTAANKGDLIVYDSTSPIRHIKLGDGAFEDLSFSISKSHIASEGRIFENVAIPHAKIIAPLANCFEFISQNISSASPEELSAIGAACAALLAVAPGRSAEQQDSEAFDFMSGRHAREMMHFIDAHLGDSELSPRAVAEHLGISVRYVHKQFASVGRTFSDYLKSKRLEHISFDLVSDAGRHQLISNLAYRWGFNDLSTFNRAFKKKFGCLPSEYRAKF